MKLLHTSDWHLGHILYGYERAQEQESMLLQMIEIVKNEKPDVFLVCGDIYHTSQPSNLVQTMFTNAIVDLHKANPDMTIIVTAGNHDSGSKHEIFSTPWKVLNVHAIGTVNENETGNLIVEIPGKGYVIAVPYINERFMPEGLYQELLDKANERNKNNLPVILATHTAIKGSYFEGHEGSTESIIGDIKCSDIEKMGVGYDYLALGHIHRPQFVEGGENRVRYSGSPLAVSFDEAYSHTVSIVEISKHGEVPQVREVEIVNPHPLVTLPTNDALPFEEVKKLLVDFPGDNEAFIRLNVSVDDFLPVETQHEAELAIEGKKCRLCLINAVRNKTEKAGAASEMTVQEFAMEKPIDIAKKYAAFANENFDSDMEGLFNEVLVAVEEENRM